MEADKDEIHRFRDYNLEPRLIFHDGKLLHKKLCSSSKCGKTGNDLKKCAKCKTTYYCDEICQRNDWSVHKTLCKYKGDTDWFDLMFLAYIGKGVEFFKTVPYSKFEISHFNTFLDNILKLREEYVKIYKHMKTLTGDFKNKGIALTQIPGKVNVLNRYLRATERMGLIYKPSSLEEWTESIIKFDLMNEIKKIKKLTYILDDSAGYVSGIIWIKDGKLIDPNDEVKILKISLHYRESFEEVLKYMDSKPENSFTIDTLVYEHESCMIYHFIHDETNMYTFIRGKIFFIDVEVKD